MAAEWSSFCSEGRLRNFNSLFQILITFFFFKISRGVQIFSIYNNKLIYYGNLLVIFHHRFLFSKVIFIILVFQKFSSDYFHFSIYEMLDHQMRVLQLLCKGVVYSRKKKDKYSVLAMCGCKSVLEVIMHKLFDYYKIL